MSGEHDHLADNIKALREARGLSQQQIAKAAGVPRATWTHLESGAANPTLAVLIKVANALQVRLDEMLAAPRPPARHILASKPEWIRFGAGWAARLSRGDAGIR